MRGTITWVLLLALGCGPSGSPSTPITSPKPPPSAPSAVDAGDTAEDDCLTVQEETPRDGTVSGVLRLRASPRADSSFVLELARPRCVVGLAHAHLVTEVYIATSGPDLRPLVDQRLRITGATIGAMNDMGGSAIIILARDIERDLTD